ncbi:MAG TPA: DEAD/DEAH box helicase [Mycobacterium sp.]|nr:DEAD/DEAH box helicase [Mycobacterium sp.]
MSVAEQHVLPLFAPRRMIPQAAMVPSDQPPAGAVEKAGIVLRDYQGHDVGKCVAHLEAGRSPLLVQATGLGKTVQAAAISQWAIRRSWRVLFLVHRNTLARQARRALSKFLGEYVSLERAEWRMGDTSVVVGSVQTLKGKRLAAIDPARFDLIVTDEAHRSAATSYRAIYAHFPKALRLGLTATPQRADKKPLAAYDVVVSGHDFLWGIREGYLVEPDWKVVEDSNVNLAGVDLSKVDAVDHEMVKATATIVDEAGKVAGRTLVFAPGVKTAHAVSDGLNTDRAGCARAVDANTDEDVRTSAEEGHKADLFQYLCNCGIYGEGYDDPQLAAIVMGRPTNSMTVFLQVFGRGGRPAVGVADLPTREERLAAIAASSKPRWNFIDITGAGARNLVTPVDVLGDGYTPEERARAKKTLKAKGGSVTNALEVAREDLVRIKAIAAAATKAKVTSRSHMVTAFDTFGVRDPERSLRIVNPELLATQKMVNLLRYRHGIDVPDQCTKRQFRLLMGQAAQRAAQGLCNFKQIKWLQRFGIDARRMPEAVGREIATAYRANGKIMPHVATIEAIVSRGREVGANG